MPHVLLCVKDPDGRYVAANDAFVRRARRRHADEVIGRRAADLFPGDLAAAYDAQDRTILRTGQALRNQLEVIPDAGGGQVWCLTTKALVAQDGDEPLIVAVSVVAPLGRSASAAGLRAAVSFVASRMDQRIRVSDLASAAGMSPSRLERMMRRVLGVSPKAYVLRARADAAARLLATTDESIAGIATRCGYYDQSQLTRQFKARVGLTPNQYRALSRGRDDGPISART
jgi:PAS domain S-box-containing protein